MTARIVNHDPEPWVRPDENGRPFRAHTAHEDGVDENGVEWTAGWEHDPRAEFNEVITDDDYWADPEPWVCDDENGRPYRTRYAHEDGVDANGLEWSGWRYEPRTREEYVARYGSDD